MCAKVCWMLHEVYYYLGMGGIITVQGKKGIALRSEYCQDRLNSGTH